MSAEALEDTLSRWAAEQADPATGDIHRRMLKDWAVGASIALRFLGYDDLARMADDIWNPRREK